MSREGAVSRSATALLGAGERSSGVRAKLARSVSVHEPWQQARYDVRFAWGPAGAACVGRHGGVLVIVDVLSFTTSVGVAVERGVAVYPAAARDAGAVELAETLGAVLAVDRREVTTAHPWSLSPATLRSARAPARLVLPSPSRSATAAAAGGTRLTRALSRGTRSTVTVRASECSSSPQRVSCSGSGSRCPSRTCWARHEPASCASLGRVPACPGCAAQG